MSVLASHSCASVVGWRCTWVPSRDGNVLSRELQQTRQCKHWCLAASGGWFAISEGCTISAGDTGRAQEWNGGAKDVQGACHCRYVKGNGRLGGAIDYRIQGLETLKITGFIRISPFRKLCTLARALL